jgi:hypothetical protein
MIGTKDGGRSTLANFTGSDPGSYIWTVPHNVARSCLIEVILKDSKGKKVGSDRSGNFSIEEPVIIPRIGVLMDAAPLINITYKTSAGYMGKTSFAGTFAYLEGEVVTFSIGDFILGQTKGKDIITVVDIVGAADSTGPASINMSRFLQSLGTNRTLDNGIDIQWKVDQRIKGRNINFSQSTADFDNDPEVLGLFDALNGDYYFPGISAGVLMSAELADLYLKANFMNRDKERYSFYSDLKQGFPVAAYGIGGTYRGGPVIHNLVGDINGDGFKEILVSGITAGPLFAIRHDGELLAYFGNYDGVVYPSLGRLDLNSQGLDIFYAAFWGILSAYTGADTALPLWSRAAANYVTSPAALADVDFDGLDEIFINEEDSYLHAYKADGTTLPGWPVYSSGNQSLSTPNIGDIDNDGVPEIIWVSGDLVNAVHADGTIVDGFPVLFKGFADNFSAVGDVDGDGNYEIVVGGGYYSSIYKSYVNGILIISNSGVIKYTIDLSYHDISYGSAPALADLNNDGIPEILFQTEAYLMIYTFDKDDFKFLAGWPQRLSHKDTPPNNLMYFSSPVVGDIDGDGEQEIVLTVSHSGTCGREVDEIRAYKTNGLLHSNFPKVGALGFSGTPAIADIDMDGRNEIVIRGCDCTYDPIVWVYDLNGGYQARIEWGQFGRDHGHNSFYPKTK